MWPWRKRSPFESLDLPKKLFISHSYRDAEARERLLKLLPKGVEPFIFPPITVPPEQMISDRLLNAIRACDGLIYLRGGASAQSFWVALERDYALRLDKSVFAFDAARSVLERDQSSALDLKVFVSSSQQEVDQTRHIIAILRQRFIDVWFERDALGKEGLSEYPFEAAASSMSYALKAGGYELEQSEWLQSNRTLFAVVEMESPPVPLQEDKRLVVQLFADGDRSVSQRIDDLIVRLYWLIYRNTRQNQLS